MKNISIIWSTYLILLIAGIIFFRAYPQSDIQFSRLFFIEQNQSFINSPIVNFLCGSVFYFTLGIALFSALIFISLLFSDYQSCDRDIGLTIKKVLKNLRRYFFAVYLGSAVIFVSFFLCHFLFKTIFHRPRPHNVQEFGGEMSFTKAWDIQGECRDKCSFPSSHAAAGYLPYSLLWVSSRGNRERKERNKENSQEKSNHIDNLIEKIIHFCEKNRKKIFIFSTALGMFFGLLRVIMGYHFLSDIIFSGFITFFAVFIIEKAIAYSISSIEKMFE